MPDLVYFIGAITLGFAGLIWSADRFVDGSAAIARRAGLSPLIIGLTIVSFGTSAPEILVSLNAALEGAGELAIGNALGSNLANVGLVLGITALIATLPIQKHILRDELPILLTVTAVAGYFIYDSKLEFWEGIVLLALIVPVIGYLIHSKKRSLSPEEIAAEQDLPNLPVKMAVIWFVIGLILLVISSKILVWGATNTAGFFGVSTLIIGLTVVAVGTSLPELAASVVSALKGHHDIALGNVIGSNIFNLLAVMSVPALIDTLDMERAVFVRDYLSMAGITLFLALSIAMTFWVRRAKPPGIGKTVGILLLICYMAYYYFLFATS